MVDLKHYILGCISNCQEVNMQDIKQYVIDYVEGRVSSKEFRLKVLTDRSIVMWLQSIVPTGEKMMIVEGFNEYGSAITKYVPYNIEYQIKNNWKCENGTTENELNMIYEIFRLLNEAFPELNLVVDETLGNKYDFILDACPEYLLSVEIEQSGIIDSLMQEIPSKLSKTKRIDVFKTKLKKMFYVEGRKYPRWIQESEWPLSKTGKPTKFLRQKSIGELTYYYFLDVDTDEEIEIMQSY